LVNDPPNVEFCLESHGAAAGAFTALDAAEQVIFSGEFTGLDSHF